ncbi:hypothetical protein SEA_LITNINMCQUEEN_40 [Gordonia phage LitninMcQueen]
MPEFKVGDRVRHVISGDVGVLEWWGPSGFGVRFDGDSGASWTGLNSVEHVD